MISKQLAVAALFLAMTSDIVVAQEPGRERLTPEEITALPRTGLTAGTSGVRGIETTVLAGDPTRPGPHTIALRVPAGTQIEAHMHRDHRSAVVVSGTWYFGYGTKAEQRLEKALGPGSFYSEPAGLAHFARTGSEAVVVFISGNGPTDTNYVARDSDPRGR